MIKEIKKLKIKVNLKELQEYYAVVQKDYQHLCWKFKDFNNVEQGVGGHILSDSYGWALQSNLEDLDKPCPPYNITKETRTEYRDTTVMFGIAKRLKDHFPYAHQFSISVHPPGTMINFHTDSDKFLKVHIPIHTNPQAYFVFEPNRRYVFTADGSMILVNTNIKHSTSNQGNSDRVHLFFKIPLEREKDIINLEESII
jgi:hypothetical protein